MIIIAVIINSFYFYGVKVSSLLVELLWLESVGSEELDEIGLEVSLLLIWLVEDMDWLLDMVEQVWLEPLKLLLELLLGLKLVLLELEFGIVKLLVGSSSVR